jgi:hypothetical protein
VKHALIMALVFAVLSAAACGSSSSTSNDDDTHCVPRNGEYACLGRTWPICPSTASPGQRCDESEPPCMGCRFKPAGNTCRCTDNPAVDAGTGGSVWECIGTGYTCE